MTAAAHHSDRLATLTAQDPGHRGQILDEPPEDDLDSPTTLETDDAADAEPPQDVDDGRLDDPDRESTSTLALWEGDEGGLSEPQRRALVVLLKQRFISARTHPAAWKTLTTNPRPLRARLNDLFLELHIDGTREVAYKRQACPESSGRAFPTLLHDNAWSREETIALVYLRSRQRGEQAAGADRTFVDRTAIVDFIAQHRPAHATDVAGDTKRASKAIDALCTAGLLVGPSTAARFEISAAIETLLPLDKLLGLLAWLKDRTADLDEVTESRSDSGNVRNVEVPARTATGSTSEQRHDL